MRTLLTVFLVLLTGCAPTTSELFLKANQSGDWAAVNARLEAEDEALQPSSCRDGFLLVCESAEACTCEQAHHLDDRLRESHFQRGNRYRH